MAIQSNEADIANLFIPNGLIMPSLAHPGENVNVWVWCQNPDPGELNAKTCLGTFYVSSAAESNNDTIWPYEKLSGTASTKEAEEFRKKQTLETMSLIERYISRVLNTDIADGTKISALGIYSLAACLIEFSRNLHAATDIVVDIRSFSEKHCEDAAKGKYKRAELQLAGTAYNRKQ